MPAKKKHIPRRDPKNTVLTISLTKEMKEKLRKAANRECRSISSFLAYYSDQYLKEAEKERRRLEGE